MDMRGSPIAASPWLTSPARPRIAVRANTATMAGSAVATPRRDSRIFRPGNRRRASASARRAPAASEISAESPACTSVNAAIEPR
jgi:hypothetical protein